MRIVDILEVTEPADVGFWYSHTNRAWSIYCDRTGISQDLSWEEKNALTPGSLKKLISKVTKEK